MGRRSGSLAEGCPRASATWRTPPVVGETGQVLEGAANVAPAAFEEDVAGARQVLASDFLGELLGLVDMDLEEIAAVLRAGLVAGFGGALFVIAEGHAGGLETRREHDVGVAPLGCPLHRPAADGAGDHDEGMG